MPEPTISGGLDGGQVRRATIADVLRRRARRDRFADAFVGSTPDGRRLHLTYGDLDSAVNRMAHLLEECDAARGDIIAGMCRNGADHVIAYYAALRIGAAYTGINPSLTSGELAYQLEHSDPKVVIVGAGSAGLRVREARPGTTVLETSSGSDSLLPDTPLGAAVAEFPDHEPARQVDELDLAMLIYTSGTESLPKGVRVPHRNFLIATTQAWLMERYIEPDDRFLLLAPMYTMAGLGTVTNLLSIGATVVMSPGTGPEAVAEVIASERITNMSQTPTFYGRLVEASPFRSADLSSLRQCHTYGGAIPRAVIDAVQMQAPQAIWATYWGQTELSQLGSIGFYRRPEEIPDRDPRWIGKPVPQVEVRVVDEQGADAEIGELLCRSPAVMDGYHKAPELTAAVIFDGWLHTGDIVRMDRDSNLFFHDRKKDMIKTGGMNVSSLEVETAILDFPEVAAVAVIGVPDPEWTEAVTAFVVPRSDAEIDGPRVIESLKSRLAPYKVPKRVMVVDDLPRDLQGKVLKRELRRQAAG